MLLAVVAACAGETVEVPGETVVVEKVVTETVEVPGETVVVKEEVIRTVEVPGETVTKEVVKEVMVPGETVVVEKEVVKTVEVPGETVTVEVVKEVQVPGETVVVEKEVVKTVEVPGQTVVVEKVIVQEVAGKNYVTDPSTGRTVPAPEFGGTITAHGSTGHTGWALDSNLGYPSLTDGVIESIGIVDWGVDRNVWDLQTLFTPDHYLTGLLVEDWDISSDGLTYTLNVRPSARWHNKAPMDGRQVTAQDIEWNFHRMLGMGDFAEAGPSPFGGTDQLKNIPWDSITATDDSTVVMKLTEPRLDALRILLLDWFASVFPPEVIEQTGPIEDWRNLVGTGPFEMTDLVEESSVTLTKNPDYYDFDEKYPENRLPYVDQIRTLIIPEEASILAALRTRKLDWRRWGTSLDSADSIRETNPEITVQAVYFRSRDSFAPNHRKPPFDNINVRRAMQMALDNPTIAATYWKGNADPTPAGLIGVDEYFTPFEEWDGEVKQWYRYDPEAAEKLLDEAGYERGADGIRFKTVLNYGSWATLDIAEIAAAYWAAIGVDVQIDNLSYAEYHERLFGRTADGMYSAISGNKFDPLMAVSWYHSSSQWNRGGSQWPELDAMVDAALSATTTEEQQRLVAETDKYAMSRHWLIWGPKAPTFFYAQPWVVGYSGELDGALGAGTGNGMLGRLWIDSELKAAMGH